jgi:integration host factor subunit alpha
MTKSDLASEVNKESGLPKKETSDVVELILDTLKKTLAEGETIKIAGFGTFLVRKKGARKGRNLKTGEEIFIAPRKVVTFKPSNQFKAMVESPPF